MTFLHFFASKVAGRIGRLTERKRKFLFFFVCIPVRITLAVVVGVILPSVALLWLNIIFGSLFVLQSIPWIIYIMGKVHRETGAFGGQAFWAPARPMMLICSLSTSALCFAGTKSTLKAGGFVQGADVISGIALYLVHYNLRFVYPPLES